MRVKNIHPIKSHTSDLREMATDGVCVCMFVVPCNTAHHATRPRPTQRVAVAGPFMHHRRGRWQSLALGQGSFRLALGRWQSLVLQSLALAEPGSLA